MTLQDYYISDILALVDSIDKKSTEADNLTSALRASVAYYGHTSDKNELTGLAVSLPYGDPAFYKKLSKVYKKIGLEDDYIDWLGNFVSSSSYDDYNDYGDFEDSWDGWGSCDGEYGCSISGNTDDYGYYEDDGYYDYDYDEYYDDDWVYDYDSDEWYCYDDYYSMW